MTKLLTSRPAVSARRLTEKSTLVVVLFLATLNFVIDALVPLGVAGGVPYVVVILVALRSNSARFVYCVAALCSVLTIVDIAISPGPGTTEWWKVIVNRCLALFVIWVTAILGRQRNLAAEAQRRHLADLAHLSRTKTAECLAGSLAHELNQPLVAIALQAEIASELFAAIEATSSAPEGGLLKGSLKEITEQSHRASMIVRALRDLVRRAPSERQLTEVNTLIQDCVRLIQPAAREADVELRLQMEDGLPLVEVDRIQIQQVILNLLQNAVDALVMSNVDERLINIASRSSLAHSPTREIVVEVTDTGPGLMAEQRERLFEAFSSTKPHGLGLGLNISRSIIEAHGGNLTLVNDGGCAGVKQFGTRFALNLPC